MVTSSCTPKNENNTRGQFEEELVQLESRPFSLFVYLISQEHKSSERQLQSIMVCAIIGVFASSVTSHAVQGAERPGTSRWMPCSGEDQVAPLPVLRGL